MDFQETRKKIKEELRKNILMNSKLIMSKICKNSLNLRKFL